MTGLRTAQRKIKDSKARDMRRRDHMINDEAQDETRHGILSKKRSTRRGGDEGRHVTWC